MATETINQEKESGVLVNQDAEPKKCQFCDLLLKDADSFCRRCGALWCETDGNLNSHIIQLFDPQDYTQYSLMPSSS